MGVIAGDTEDAKVNDSGGTPGTRIGSMGGVGKEEKQESFYNLEVTSKAK